jgi:receptor protein-tyrosine kinase
MATAVASENKKCIIIDGDLRRPRVQEVFETKIDGPGLTDLLTGKITDMKKAVQKSHIPGLFFMTAGAGARNPVALLKSQTMQDIVEACKKAFDFIIIDAPPILGLADASIISRYTDGLILVAKQGHTAVDVLRRAHDAVIRAQGRPIGVVLNMAEPRIGGQYYYNSKHYQRYYHRSNA